MVERRWKETWESLVPNIVPEEFFPSYVRDGHVSENDGSEFDEAEKDRLGSGIERNMSQAIESESVEVDMDGAGSRRAASELAESERKSADVESDPTHQETECESRGLGGDIEGSEYRLNEGEMQYKSGDDTPRIC